MSTQPRCPKCGSGHEFLIVERRPDGDAKCKACKWSGPYDYCFPPIRANVGVESVTVKVKIPPISPKEHFEDIKATAQKGFETRTLLGNHLDANKYNTIIHLCNAGLKLIEQRETYQQRYIEKLDLAADDFDMVEHWNQYDDAQINQQLELIL